MLIPKTTKIEEMPAQMPNSHDHIHAPNRFALLPLAERLHTDAHFTGRSARIAFLDSGFYSHDDLKNRFVALHNVAGGENALETLKNPLPKR